MSPLAPINMEVTHFGEKKIRDNSNLIPLVCVDDQKFPIPKGNEASSFLLNFSFSFQLHKGIILIILKKNERA